MVEGVDDCRSRGNSGSNACGCGMGLSLIDCWCCVSVAASTFYLLAQSTIFFLYVITMIQYSDSMQLIYTQYTWKRCITRNRGFEPTSNRGFEPTSVPAGPTLKEARRWWGTPTLDGSLDGCSPWPSVSVSCNASFLCLCVSLFVLPWPSLSLILESCSWTRLNSSGRWYGLSMASS